MGRRKIEIQPLTDDRNRTVTFVKRKAGLFKKAHELAVLCQVDLAVIIVGNNNKLYEFSSVDTNELIKTYQKTPKKHESKSPANYGNYKKKKHLTQNLGVINDDEYNDYNDDNDDDDEDEANNNNFNDNNDNSDYDSETPEPRPKRQKRSFGDMNTNSRLSTRSTRGSTLGQRQGRQVKNVKEPPSHISLPNVPNLNSFRTSNSIIKEEDEDDHRHDANYPYRSDSINSNSTNQSGAFNPLRPILRVQIPTDAKGSGTDSARTLTALDTNPNSQSNQQSGSSNHQLARQQLQQKPHQHRDESTPDSAKSNASNSNNSADSSSIANGNQGNGPSINTPKYSSFSTFRSPDTRKPITTLPIPIHSKSQTSSPSSATAPALPVSGMTSFFNTLPQPSPSSQYPNSTVPTPILNQVFNDPKVRYQQGQSQGSQQPPQVPSSGPQQPQQPQQGPSQTNGNNSNNNNVNNDAPMSGLPSRYVNDIFPSPSNFYVPQDWPNSGTGMTPVHNHLPQYFINMIPSASQMSSRSHSQSQPSSNQYPMGPNMQARASSNPDPPSRTSSDPQPPTNAPTDSQTSSQPGKPQLQPQQLLLLLSQPPPLPVPVQSNRSSQGLNYQFPSPLQFMSPSFNQDDKK